MMYNLLSNYIYFSGTYYLKLNLQEEFLIL